MSTKEKTKKTVSTVEFPRISSRCLVAATISEKNKKLNRALSNK